MARKKSPFKIPLSSIGIFPSHWEISTLSRACALVTDGTHDSPKVAPYGYPLVTGKCITGGRVKFEEAYLISERDHRAVIARSKAEFGDILFANIGNSIGELARVESDEEFSIKNVALFKPSERVESLFLKYYLGSPAVQTYIRGNTFGSAQPFIGLGTLRGFPIPLPPLPEQKAIAHILGSLDDKIELNRRMNETLEAMAQALFKSWFVDFDPVIDNALAAGNDIPEPLKAKAATREALGDARKPLPEDIRQYFPCRFEFTEEMGWIPEGWKTKSLYETATFINGAAFKNKDFSPTGEGIPVVKIAELKSGISSQTKFTKKIFPNKYLIENDEILYSWSGSPDTSLDVFKWFGGKGWLNQHIFKISTKSEPEKIFVFNLLRQIKPILIAIATDKQTTGLGHVTIADMKRLFVAYPNKALLSYFYDKGGSLYKKVSTNEKQSRSLSKTRDTLLPKLLSGELRIPDAEKIVEEVL